LDGGWNRFGYAGANPLHFVDSSGLFVETLWDIGNLGYDLWNKNWDDAAWDAAAVCIPGVPAGLTKIKNPLKAFSKDKQALVDMAKKDKKSGITSDDMQAYKDLNKQLPDPFPTNAVRGPEAHSSGAPSSQMPHGHVGPVDHISITSR
jgi:hypothetical protein